VVQLETTDQLILRHLNGLGKRPRLWKPPGNVPPVPLGLPNGSRWEATRARPAPQPWAQPQILTLLGFWQVTILKWQGRYQLCGDPKELSWDVMSVLLWMDPSTCHFISFYADRRCV
jgi:hypothetical protein